MSARAARREELQARIAERLLAAGLAQIPLRDLASDLGTSDRMLLYYFKDKTDLVEASLEVVASRLSATLEEAVTAGRRPPGDLLLVLLQALGSETSTAVMSVWADIVARGGRGEEPFRRIAARSVARWLDWLDSRLDIESPTERRAMAAAILTSLEGARQLEASAPGSTAGVGPLLARALRQV